MKTASQSSTYSSGARRPVRKQLWFDSMARAVITSGGVGTIVVALLIVVVMISQLLPLIATSDVTTVNEFRFDSGTKGSSDSTTIDRPNQGSPICAGMDEYGDMTWFLMPSGNIDVYATSTGTRLQSFVPPEGGADLANLAGREITAFSVADDDASLLIGYSTGEVRPITIHWVVEYLDSPTNDDNAASLPPGDNMDPTGDDIRPSVSTVLPNGLVRVQRIESIDYHEPIAVLQSPVRCVDWLKPEAIYGLEKIKSWKWLASDGVEIVVQHHLRRRQGISVSTKEEIKTWRTARTSELASESATESVVHAMLNAQGEGFTTIGPNGLARLWRLDTEPSIQQLASHWTISGSESTVNGAVPILGRNTLLISSESGELEGVAPFFGSEKSDLVSIHRIAIGSMGIKHMAAATNSRVVSALSDDGIVTFLYVPTDRKLLEWSVEPGSQIFFSSGSRYCGVLRPNSVTVAKLNLRFPEAGWRSFLSANWFEGYDSPRHLWQSSSGTVQGEIKLSIVPLLFGTIKGTFYTLLIAIPLGLVSAIFSSEYLDPTNRARIKPIMELMASVPSVALGFVGAVAVAPLVRDQLFGVLLVAYLTLGMLVSIPTFLALLPQPIRLLANHRRELLLILVLIVSIAISNIMAARLESLLFGGPLTLWLNGEFGHLFPGWLCLWLIPCGVATFWASNHFHIERKLSERYSLFRKETAFGAVIMQTGLLITCVVSASAIAMALSLLGWDARGTMLDSYQERNALLVGIVLGFAIVPLIFTLSEDALQAVPQHLRAASMSCGATVWQTAMRVVIPTALSGLFSAVMLGLGRAIGETMVVLMVSGNSPIMELNPFNGFRTLSATLAMELPEAARGSTHYHSLFFVSLVLFFLTVVVNSIAEFVRLKFKKNASQL
ncbi:MAG: ABC transporter permease subunit [Pirellula sp.]